MNAVARASFVAMLMLAVLAFVPAVNASSANPINSTQVQTVYVGHSISLHKLTVNLTGVSTVITGGNYVYPAVINVYYGGNLTNVTQILPGTTYEFSTNGKNVFVYLNSTFYSNSTSQQYALMKACSQNPSNKTVSPDCSKLKTVQAGSNMTHDKFRIELVEVDKEVYGATNDTSYAYLDIFYKNSLKQNASISLGLSGSGSNPQNTTEFTVNGHTVFIDVSQIFDGLYAYQKWATMQVSISSKTPAQNTIYVGHNETCGKFTFEVQDLSQPNSDGISDAAVAVYYKGDLTNVTEIPPRTLYEFNTNGHYLDVYVNQTFAGLYAYQKWAKVQLFC